MATGSRITRTIGCAFPWTAGVEIRSSVDTGDVSGNTLTHNRAPQLVVNGTNFTMSNNAIQP